MTAFGAEFGHGVHAIAVDMTWVFLHGFSRNVVQVLDFFIPGRSLSTSHGSSPNHGASPGEMSSFTEIYMIMELCDSDLKKLCRR